MVVSAASGMRYVDSYTVYLDANAAVSVASSENYHDFTNVASGPHLVQVVTNRGPDVSIPITEPINVPDSKENASSGDDTQPAVGADSSSDEDPPVSTERNLPARPTTTVRSGAAQNSPHDGDLSLTGTLAITEAPVHGEFLTHSQVSGGRVPVILANSEIM